MGKKKLLELVSKMKRTDPSGIRAALGFDGFVDEVVHVVEYRIDQEHYERVKYLADYGKKIMDAAGLSLNIEMVPIQKKLGGNGVILANSLMEQGMDLTYLGALGKEHIHEVFEPMKKSMELISFSDPGLTDAVEFYDGKIISSKLENLKEVNWERLRETITPDNLARLFDACQLIGFENWTLVVNSTSIWKGILEEVIPMMQCRDRKVLFIDLADPQKRSLEDIREALGLLKKYEAYFEVILGLNEKEAYEITELYGKTRADFSQDTEACAFLKEQLEISTVVMHPVKTAAACSGKELCEVQGPYCAKPKLTTGAGDNFNAGFLLGRMLGLPLEESLLLGTANSGFYVRNARSCTYKELIGFLEDWAVGKCE